MSADLSFVHLIFEASPVVQLIMLSLVGISIWSWTVIFRKRSRLESARKEADGFESTFWSGTDLTSLYSGMGKEEGAHGMQAIFVAGFREFLRSRSQSDPDTVVGSSRRAMRAAMSREMETTPSRSLLPQMSADRTLLELTSALAPPASDSVPANHSTLRPPSAKPSNRCCN